MHTKTYIYIVYQNLDLYHIPKLGFKVLVFDIYQGFAMLHKSKFWYAI
jgi:hypothetical protein